MYGWQSVKFTFKLGNTKQGEAKTASIKVLIVPLICSTFNNSTCEMFVVLRLHVMLQLADMRCTLFGMGN